MTIRTALMAAGLIIAQTCAGWAASVPANGNLQFDVIRKGKDIGDHSFSFSSSGGDATVKVRTNVEVKVSVIRTTAYRFDHASTEVWKGASLAGIASQTNDDGTPHELSVKKAEAYPASLWSEDVTKQTRLLNTIDGHVMSVSISDLGVESVKTESGNLQAHHYRMAGDLARELWYDDAGLLAKLVMTAEDGSTVTYLRK